MSEDIKSQLREAIEKSKGWANTGWEVTFGPHRHPVNNITEAKDLPRNHPNRQEAQAYWRNVELIGKDVSTNLEAALAELESGNVKGATTKAYTAQYVEKPLEHITNTSKPVFAALQALG